MALSTEKPDVSDRILTWKLWCERLLTRKKEMLLYLDENGFSDEFHNKIQALSQGSKIHIMESKDSYY